jgi:hypothetical protein
MVTLAVAAITCATKPPPSILNSRDKRPKITWQKCREGANPSSPKKPSYAEVRSEAHCRCLSHRIVDDG